MPLPGELDLQKMQAITAAALKATSEARAQGYDQVLWTDAFEHKWLQEVGTMNVFFVFGKTVVTPSLEEGTILEGVTRDSVIQVLREQGLTVEERKISIDEVVEGTPGRQTHGNLWLRNSGYHIPPKRTAI